jgi:hypothetical protein
MARGWRRWRATRFGMALAALVLLCACGRSPAAKDARLKPDATPVHMWNSALAGFASASDLDRIARTYIELVAALAQRDADSASGDTALTAQVDVAGSSDSTTRLSGPNPTLAVIASLAQEAIDTLRTSTTAAADPGRRDWLFGQLVAIQTRASLQNGARVHFDQELQRLFGVRPAAVDHVRLGLVAKDLAAMLPGTGSAAERLARLDAQATVTPERLPHVFRRALAECRTRTVARLSLPADEQVDVTFVHGEPWSAFSTYLGYARSRIDVNTAYALTVDRVLDLACHEGYPGHHVINLTRDARAASGRPELTAVPLFSPESFAAEAVASNAASLVFTDDDRLEFERDVLFPLAGLRPEQAALHVKASRLLDRLAPAITAALTRYLAGERDFIETSWDLQERALMQHPQATLLFANQFRGFALAYTWEKGAGSEGGEPGDPIEQQTAMWRRYAAVIGGDAYRP